jgi:hypothetical protein
MRVEHLHVEDRIDADLDVVACDADLLGNVDRNLLEAVAVGNRLGERNENVKAGCSVRLYLPRYSTTNALCCGTTVAVLAMMITARMAITMAP